MRYTDDIKYTSARILVLRFSSTITAGNGVLLFNFDSDPGFAPGCRYGDAQSRETQAHILRESRLVCDPAVVARGAAV
jgi:hypothetical protein